MQETVVIRELELPMKESVGGKADSFDEAGYLLSSTVETEQIIKAHAMLVGPDGEAPTGYTVPVVELPVELKQLALIKAAVARQVETWQDYSKRYSSKPATALAGWAVQFVADNKEMLTLKQGSVSIKLTASEALKGTFEGLLKAFGRGMTVKNIAKAHRTPSRGAKIKGDGETENYSWAFELATVVTDKGGQMAKLVELLAKAVVAAEKGETERSLGITLHVARLLDGVCDDPLTAVRSIVQGALYGRAALALKVKLSDYENGLNKAEAAKATAA